MWGEQIFPSECGKNLGHIGCVDCGQDSSFGPPTLASFYVFVPFLCVLKKNTDILDKIDVVSYLICFCACFQISTTYKA